MLENIEGALKNEQPRKTGNIGYTGGWKTKQNTTQYVRLHYRQTNTNNVNKTRSLLQTTWG